MRRSLLLAEGLAKEGGRYPYRGISRSANYTGVGKRQTTYEYHIDKRHLPHRLGRLSGSTVTNETLAVSFDTAELAAVHFDRCLTQMAGGEAFVNDVLDPGTLTNFLPGGARGWACKEEDALVGRENKELRAQKRKTYKDMS